MSKIIKKKLLQHSKQQGFTLVEVMCAMTILLIGVLAAISVVVLALKITLNSRHYTASKMAIASMHEQVETLRNTGQLTFKQIGNTNQCSDTAATRTFNCFPTAFMPITREPGADGVFGTTDDPTTGADFRYARSVIITDLSETLKRVRVTVQFSGVGGNVQQVSMDNFLNDNRRANQIN